MRVRFVVAAIFCALVGVPLACSEPDATLVSVVEPGGDVPARVASAPPVVAAPPPAVVAQPEPPPPPPPPPDPEALARARAEAERAALEAEWPLHGLTYHFLAQVHARPDGSSRVVGYTRRGARFRARAPVAGAGCARGWSEVPGEGFVCRGGGYLVGDEPPTFDPLPVQPALSDALPYAYAYVGRTDAAQYWRVPTPEEERIADGLVSDMRGRVDGARAAVEAAAAAEAARLARAAAPPAPRETGGTGGTGASGATDPGAEAAVDPALDGVAPPDAALGGEPEPGLEAPPGAVEVAGTEAPSAGPAVVPLGVDAGAGTALLPDFFRMRMESGFYVSIDREEEGAGRRYFRTVRGAYVPADAMVLAEPPAMRGVVLGERWRLPIGFVYRHGATALVRDPVRGTLSSDGELTYHDALILEDEIVERPGGRYRVSRRGIVAREGALRIATAIPRPPGVREDERWIHVNLSTQTLVAYEGDTPVFVTLVSSGREGFETHTGTFRIQSKHVSTTMDDTDSLMEAYSIEDVPWTMYFDGSYALHAAFWHDNFGRPRSHGCVNLSPADARWLFSWAGPTLPPGWHGVIASSRRVGTVVHITE